MIQFIRKDAEKIAFFMLQQPQFCCRTIGKTPGGQQVFCGMQMAMQREHDCSRRNGMLCKNAGGVMAEPIMCPYCGGTNLFQEDDYGIELDYETWTIHHWDCLDCSESFDKIEILPASNAFEVSHESTIH